MTYRSINPYTGHLLHEYTDDPLPDLRPIIAAYQAWKGLSIAERSAHLARLSTRLNIHQSDLAYLITSEMGKPYRESLYEINKCLTAFDYYIHHAETILAPQVIATAATESYVSHEPLGIIVSVMPWNFPFWQVFRFAIPALMAGNVTILKHSPNVPQCAQAIAQCFVDAGLPIGVFTNLRLSNEDTAALIAHPAVAGVSFTGSDATGSIIASLAGKHIKKSVVELGGNDPFIVLDDANVELAVAGAIKSRSINSGQSCNAAKRFIVTEAIYDRFVPQLIAAVAALVVGDPMDDATQIGPIARLDLADKVRSQIQATIDAGAIAHYHPHKPAIEPNNIVYPIVLEGVVAGMEAFEQEVFGAVWSIVKAKDTAHAISLANQSIYGLGASIWTADTAAARPMLSQLEAGNVFLNDIVKSDARMPFGGIKRSGYGRELSALGMLEFVNYKTCYIK
jgi:succinate-semialdehyde dehydrogenase / glutarate-semialdehyde dehydrogenase